MSLWYSRSATRYQDKGKFHQRARTGLTRSGQSEHRGWLYHFTSHQTGMSVRRTSYSVTITDPFHNRVEYLRGFSSLEQATAAAHEWIDEVVAKKGLGKLGTPLGDIPKFPNAAVNPVKP